jgi:hypothetical protein
VRGFPLAVAYILAAVLVMVACRPPVALSPLDLACVDCDVVLINVGLLRADRVGLIEPRSGQTPQIDKFFAHGLVFDDAMAPSGATYLSATAIATATDALLNDHEILVDDAFAVGIPAHEIDDLKVGGGRWLVLAMLEREGPLLVDRLPTLAENLSAAGYGTMGFNDWIHTGRFVGLDRGYDDFVEFTDTRDRTRRGLTSTVPVAEQVAAVAAGVASPSDTPRLLYFHPNTLHFPLPDPDSPGEVLFRSSEPTLFARAYDASVREVDRALGALFEALRSSGRLDRTIVVLYSNHGCSLGDTGPIGVGDASSGTVRVPLLIRHPAVSDLRRVDAPVSLVDLVPTILDVVGVDPILKTPAFSLRQLAEDGTAPPRTLLLGRDLQAEYVRRGDRMLTIEATGSTRLLDLGQPPGSQVQRGRRAAVAVLQLRTLLEQARVRQLTFAQEVEETLGVWESQRGTGKDSGPSQAPPKRVSSP